MKIILLSLLLLPLLVQSQNREIEKIVNRIDFEEDTVKAVFDWITNNISYDVSLLKKIKLNGIENVKLNQNKESRISNVLKNKRGVCQHYSELFDEIMTHLGYQSVVIAGYTRSPITQKLNSVGHAWNSVKTDNKWILLDATWGAGYVTNKNVFEKRYKSEYYNMNPTEAIFSHIPYDPLWQLLEQQVSYTSFEKQTIDKKNLRTITNYKEIEKYLQLNEIDQKKEALSRSKEMGKPNALVQRWQDIKIQNINVDYRNSMVKVYNNAAEIMRNATTKFNDYVHAKNNKFRSSKWTKKTTKAYMTALLEDAERANQQFLSIKDNDPTMSSDLTATLKNSTSFVKLVNKELYFIDNQWSKSK